MRRLASSLHAALMISLLIPASVSAKATDQGKPAPLTSAEERATLHEGSDWALIAPHLPNPATADARSLETAADVLRARRFPEDALDYYGYAMARGGNVSELLNKMGVLRLELRQTDLARAMFLRTVRANRRNAEGWNNLGVAEYVSQNYAQAISDYRRASKLDHKSAVFHANMGLAYFDAKDPDSARKQFALAIRLDPLILQRRDEGGGTMRILGTKNYPALCFEMAKVYAREHDIAAMRLALAKAIEGGFNVRDGMAADLYLQRYLKDPELLTVLANADGLRRRNIANIAVPKLGAPAQEPK